MYLLYNLALLIASPILLTWALVRWLRGRLPGLPDRLGLLPPIPSPSGGPHIWLHAVSLGEMKLAASLAAELRELQPEARFLMTASTLTGRREACRRAAAEDVVLYPPLDYPWICRRFLRFWKPDVVVLVETELWPNLIREAKRAGAAVLLVNGRLSDRSLPRYRASRLFWRRVLTYPDAFFVQSARDAERFASIGALESKIRVAGNLKFGDRPLASPLADALSAAAAKAAVGPVLVAGSTMPGEERFLLEAFTTLRQELPALWMILAPRHPERAPAVAALIQSAGLPCQLRSEWRPGSPVASGILLLDSAGELAGLYRLATAAFIGGTLVPTGGHNILEPAQFACPTVIGPSMHNFREIAAQFLAAGAVIQVQNAAELANSLRRLFRNPEAAKQVGVAARDLLERQASGLEALLQEIGSRLRGGADAAPAASRAAAAGAAS
jgi:3-deoxy-D-manno-octulosonic-acid transferase